MSVDRQVIKTVVALAQGQSDVVAVGQVGDVHREGIVVLADMQGLAHNADLQLHLGQVGGGDVRHGERLHGNAADGIPAVGIGEIEVGQDAPDIATAGVGDDLIHGTEAAGAVLDDG